MAAGDENAFAELFKNYYNQLGGFIMRLTESEALTQEIVQDVFLKIWINRTAPYLPILFYGCFPWQFVLNS